ncbi:MAG: hypothetical protein NHB32_15575 [Fischerella sp. CENA71]|nr:hypothetical protein [Fischerella sp. CENA71]
MIRKVLVLATLPLIATSFISPDTRSAAAQPTRESSCPKNNPSEFVYAYTQNYHVYICGRELPNVYVAIAKKNSRRITLPLHRTKDNYTCVAINQAYPNTYRYVLTPAELRITKNGRTIVSEKATWIMDDF